MKIAITSQGQGLDSLIDPRFGRAHWLVVVDTETDAVSAIENKVNLHAVQGAGIQSAANVARQGVQAVISGHCGPKAFKTLQAAGVSVYAATTGTVQEAVARLKQGGLQPVHEADVEGHWI